ncbi:tyrosine-type recombinase/integrase [Agrobacterium vitis]|uniref:tyrosine-type recombinase/integrase n=1 Tax=Agrobacterium vitis TaxID=373 RepID=UPI00157274A2|nr:tyrosine-type recombinase/integrase [Agrobacterium vitis]NSZ53780.1 tyrosine-type recombinase/integrase [Agrobacterium vitis]NTA32539.1 tyrosine-type recombinase/integrase [Agrobacterium vitis]
MARHKSASDRIKRREGIFYYVRRVPTALARLDQRGIVRVSLRTDSWTAAVNAAVDAERNLESLWAALAKGESKSAWDRHKAAVSRAQLEGYIYRSASELHDGPLVDLVQQSKAVVGRGADKSARRALLGAEEAPAVTLSDLFMAYEQVTVPGQVQKREDQKRRWKVAREQAWREFVDCVGSEVEFANLTRIHSRKYRDWLAARVVGSHISPETANKHMMLVSSIISTMATEYNLDLPSLFSKLKLQSIQRRRPSFTRDHVENVLLRPEALCGLNNTARMAVYLAIETGMGAEELCALRPEDIRLDSSVPHVRLTPRTGATLKTEFRERTIPLVGVSLLAAKQVPNGLERYFDKAASMSTAINKYLRKNGLLPSDKHSLYSLRHSFQDRLNEQKAPERMQADLMGHAFSRETYGDGHPISQVQEVLTAMAYRFEPAAIDLG